MLEYILKVPTGAPDDKEMPLVIVLHGRGADANDLADLAPEIDSGYRFVFPNAPRRFEPYPGMPFGYTWFDGLPPDPASIAASRQLLLELIDALVEKYPTPQGRIILSGFSQGGMMSLDCGYRTRQKLAGIVVMSGALFEGDLPQIRPEPPVLIVHGTADEMINVNMARRARRVLEEKGADVDYHEFPMGHHVTRESLDVIRTFIDKHLGVTS